MLRRSILFLSPLIVPLLAHSGTEACLTTLPSSPPFRPPVPYDGLIAPSAAFWFGTDALWTLLSVDGVWPLKNNVDKSGGYFTKLVFWHKGFNPHDEPQPPLIVTATRLDGESPSVAVAHASAVFVTGKTPPAMMTGIRIPAAGCWQVTGHYAGHRLTFVVEVQP